MARTQSHFELLPICSGTKRSFRIGLFLALKFDLHRFVQSNCAQPAAEIISLPGIHEDPVLRNPKRAWLTTLHFDLLRNFARNLRFRIEGVFSAVDRPARI